ncbi:glycosyltransferase [Leptolyngbya sp. NK1-12]|uniref:Glycosyltransferase n=1 Tax=Leptolyngbya sp. NK1-12 TaxID=2547451 RepID=A0AA96WQT9_9CYAN|nr:glycosyltransferase [Leptolyngbya sp. NK1-12]WNZ27681.1 glycosyltransferase [Leptolyngbya sp. NK1-12]
MIAESDAGQGAEALMLFSPWCYGHYPSYLYHLIRYWQHSHRQSIQGASNNALNSTLSTLNIVVVPRFFQEHQDVVELATAGPATIRFIATTLEEQKNVETAASGYRRAFAQYDLMVRYAERLKASQGLVMYFDSCQLPFVAGLKLPCPFSGIYFRPTWHYGQFTLVAPTWREQMQRWRERFFLNRLLAHPQFRTLFCLDPFVVDRINKGRRTAPAVYLPDPVEFKAAAIGEIAALKARLQIEPGRRILMAFGRLADARKGTSELVAALSLLPIERCRQLCLLLVGEPDPNGQATLEQWLLPLRQSLPIQIVTNYSYVPESEVSHYFQLADLILAPYQRHVGMSGILLLAAAAQKPVLSSNYGLMGELVIRYGLGLAVDTTCPKQITQALYRFLLEPIDCLFNSKQARCFAEQNSPEQFASTIFQHLQSHPISA